MPIKIVDLGRNNQIDTSDDFLDTQNGTIFFERSDNATGADWMRRCIPDGERRLIILSSGPFDADVPAVAILRKPIEFGLLVETVAACVQSPD